MKHSSILAPGTASLGEANQTKPGGHVNSKIRHQTSMMMTMTRPTTTFFMQNVIIFAISSLHITWPPGMQSHDYLAFRSCRFDPPLRVPLVEEIGR